MFCPRSKSFALFCASKVENSLIQENYPGSGPGEGWSGLEFTDA